MNETRLKTDRQTDSSAAAAAGTTTTISLWRWPASNDPIDGFISPAATLLRSLRYDERGRYAPWTCTNVAAVCQVCLVVRVVSHWRDTRTEKNREEPSVPRRINLVHTLLMDAGLGAVDRPRTRTRADS